MCLLADSIEAFNQNTTNESLNQIVNIVGRFTSYDSELDAYRGNWKGYVAGMGSTHGWISAQFIE